MANTPVESVDSKLPPEPQYASGDELSLSDLMLVLSQIPQSLASLLVLNEQADKARSEKQTTRIEHKFRLCKNYLTARPLAALSELSELQKILRSFTEKENLPGYLVQQKNYRGRILGVTGDGFALTVIEETDMKPDFVAWKKFMRYFPGVERFWLANGDVWRTNDRDGIFCPDRYAAAATYGFEDGICEKTFQSTDDLLFFFSEFFGERMVSVPALMLRIRAYNETRHDNYVSLVEMQISDDPVLDPIEKEGKL